MQQCKSCYKFRYELDDDGVCTPCNNKRKKPVNVRLEPKNAYQMVAYLSDGQMLTKERWFSLRSCVDKFYNNISMDDIEDRNRKIRRQKQALDGIPSDKPSPGVIYLLASNVGYYKIGKSSNLSRRIGEHLRNYPVSLDVIHVIQVLNMSRCEGYLLSLFADKKLQGEWYALNSDDVEWICSLTTV